MIVVGGGVVAGRLSLRERETIGLRQAAGVSARQIARELGRAPSTVTRELAGNSFVRFGGEYRPFAAEHAARQKRRRRRRPKLAPGTRLRTVVVEKLHLKWSPEQIAGWLRWEYPDEPEMWVSHETIYAAVYLQGRGRLRDELDMQVALRTGRIRRRPRKGTAGPVRSSRPWVGLTIADRPPEADDRALPGHWEGDLLEGAGKTVIATLVERSSRYVLLVALPGGKVSEHVTSQLAQAMIGLPAHLRTSLTWDQGSELARHAQFTIATNCEVYFCDPHSPWQRGTNENTNGLLRQYFPRGKVDFRTITQAELDAVAHQLNGRPRKTLGWQTPAQRLNQVLVAPVT
jgi:transposase, IS30 family